MLTGGSTFEFNGTSSDEFGDLMIYYLGDPGSSTEDPLYTLDLIETRLPIRHEPIFHGLTDNQNATTRDITFGWRDLVDRETVDEVAQWLTNVNGYAKLVIDEDDLSDYYFLVIFQDLQTVSENAVYAINATMVMYDQFAHEEATKTTYVISDGKIVTTGGERDTVTFNNQSSLYDYAYPKVTLQIPVGQDEFKMVNNSDKDGTRPFYFHDMSELGTGTGDEILEITVDNKNRIISSSNISNLATLYSCFGNIDEHYQYFFRLLNGNNVLSFEGTGTVIIEHENVRKVGL